MGYFSEHLSQLWTALSHLLQVGGLRNPETGRRDSSTEAPVLALFAIFSTCQTHPSEALGAYLYF